MNAGGGASRRLLRLFSSARPLTRTRATGYTIWRMLFTRTNFIIILHARRFIYGLVRVSTCRFSLSLLWDVKAREKEIIADAPLTKTLSFFSPLSGLFVSLLLPRFVRFNGKELSLIKFIISSRLWAEFAFLGERAFALLLLHVYLLKIYFCASRAERF